MTLLVQIESLRTREMTKREEYAAREDELNDRLEALQAEIGTVQVLVLAGS